MAMAVIVSTSEYRFGQIRMTLAATPHRWQVMLAKAVVTMAVAFVVGTVTAWLCVLLAKPLLPADWHLELSDPDAMRIIWGLPLFFAVAALLAMSLGAILRNSPAAITILALMSLGVEKTLLAIPKTRDAAQYLPFNAGARITQSAETDFKLSPWGGFTVFCVYAVALFLVAVILAETRDA
jgi:ABC-2 type transport system permease protein